MKEQLVSKEIAISAKEKGFNWTCMWFYDLDLTHNNLLTYRNVENYNDNIIFESKNFVSAPTQSLLQKWLRDTHKIHINIYVNHENEGDEKIRWSKSIINRYDNSLHDDAFIVSSTECHNSYEETLEQGLLEALKLI